MSRSLPVGLCVVGRMIVGLSVGFGVGLVVTDPCPVGNCGAGPVRLVGNCVGICGTFFENLHFMLFCFYLFFLFPFDYELSCLL